MHIMHQRVSNSNTNLMRDVCIRGDISLTSVSDGVEDILIKTCLFKIYRVMYFVLLQRWRVYL